VTTHAGREVVTAKHGGPGRERQQHAAQACDVRDGRITGLSIAVARADARWIVSSRFRSTMISA
jgi:hypothetical protein